MKKFEPNTAVRFGDNVGIVDNDGDIEYYDEDRNKKCYVWYGTNAYEQWQELTTLSPADVVVDASKLTSEDVEALYSLCTARKAVNSLLDKIIDAARFVKVEPAVCGSRVRVNGHTYMLTNADTSAPWVSLADGCFYTWEDLKNMGTVEIV